MQYYTSITTRYLKAAPDLYRVRMASVTDELCVSENTLLRRLKEEGTSYSRLLEEEKKRRLIQALEQNPRITGEQLSQLCGFSCSQSMVRAVRRWFDITLTEYKQLLEASC